MNKFRKWIFYNPIFYWLEWEIWTYIKENFLPYCSLYDEGFRRLGCVVCPFLCSKSRSDQAKLRKHKERWPKHYIAFEKAMLKLWDNGEWWRQTRKRYAMLPEEFIENWYRGNERSR